MSDRTCRGCAYWAAHPSRLLGENVVAEGMGECRRNAPRGPVVFGWAGDGHPTHAAVMSPFPLTHREDWCAEWQDREPI